MSSIWNEEEYLQILDFVEKYLWLFLQESSVLHQPKKVISNFLNLPEKDILFLQKIYFLLSLSVSKAIEESIPKILKRLNQSNSSSKTEVRGKVRGHIDWNLTLKRRMGLNQKDPSLFVTSISTKTYNTPEVQSLKYLLEIIENLCTEVLGNYSHLQSAFDENKAKKWKNLILNLLNKTRILLKHVLLANVENLSNISGQILQKIRGNRSKDFHCIYQCLTLYQNLLIKNSLTALQDCLSQGILKPINQDTLYEIYILFLTMFSLENSGWTRRSLRLIGRGKGSIASYKLENKVLNIYYQSLPAKFITNSLYIDLSKQFNIRVRHRQPDIIFEIISSQSRFKIIEIKRTQNKQYIVDSIYKVLGYLKDFEACFEIESFPHSILVIWKGIEHEDIQSKPIVILNKESYQKYLEKMSFFF